MVEDDVDTLINNLRIDNADNSEVSTYRDVAIDTIVSSIGGTKDDDFYKKNPRFNLAVQMLTDYYYKNKSATTASKEKETYYGVQTFILQLKPEYQKWKEVQDDVDSSNGDVE